MSNEQIASEAEKEIENHFRVTGTCPIILAAIEKAYRQGLNEGFGKGKQSGKREALHTVKGGKR